MSRSNNARRGRRNSRRARCCDCYGNGCDYCEAWPRERERARLAAVELRTTEPDVHPAELRVIDLEARARDTSI